MIAAFSAFLATSRRAAGTNCDAPVSRLSNQNLETPHVYHTPLAPDKPA